MEFVRFWVGKDGLFENGNEPRVAKNARNFFSRWKFITSV